MLGLRPVAQFEHVAQDQRFLCARACGLGAEVPDGGPHARRIGVVAVGEHGVARRLDPLRAVVVGHVSRHGVAYALLVDVEVAAHGYGGGDVEAVVFAFEPVLHALGEGRGVVLRGQRVALGGHRGQHVVVAADEGAAAVRGQEVVQLALAAAYALRTAEAVEVRTADVGNQAVVGLGDRAEQGDFAAGAGTHLHYAELRVARHGEQREGHADVVVEVALCGARAEPLGQHAVHEFLGRGLAVAAREGEDRDAQGPAVFAGQLLEGGQRVGHEQRARNLGRHVRVVHHGGRGAGGEGRGGEDVAVEGRATQREEDRARHDVP